MNTILHNKSLSYQFNKADVYNGPENFARVFCDLVKKTHIRVLDFGCGTGLLGNEIKNLFNGEMELVGVDISENMIKNANKKNCYSQIFNCNLDEMLNLYEEAVESIGFCNNKLSEFEDKINIIKRKPDNTFEIDQE